MVRHNSAFTNGQIFIKNQILSTVKIVPKPLQVGQAPCGVLKEKILGSTSGKKILQTGQANFSENNSSSIFLGFSGISNPLSLIIEIIISPLPSLNPCSTSLAILPLSVVFVKDHRVNHRFDCVFVGFNQNEFVIDKENT